MTFLFVTQPNSLSCILCAHVVTDDHFGSRFGCDKWAQCVFLMTAFNIQNSRGQRKCSLKTFLSFFGGVLFV